MLTRVRVQISPSAIVVHPDRRMVKRDTPPHAHLVPDANGSSLQKTLGMAFAFVPKKMPLKIAKEFLHGSA
jgi:hypothetical protein